MAPRAAPSSLCALLLVAICALLAISGAAAARAPPSSCNAKCAAAVAACRASLRQAVQLRDAAAIKATKDISRAYGCGGAGAAASDHCKDFSVGLLDLFAHASSGSDSNACRSIAQTCQPFCLSTRPGQKATTTDAPTGGRRALREMSERDRDILDTWQSLPPGPEGDH